MQFKNTCHAGTKTLPLKAFEIRCRKGLAAQEGNQNLRRPQQDAERMVSYCTFRSLKCTCILPLRSQFQKNLHACGFEGTPRS